MIINYFSFLCVSISPFSGSAAFYLVAKWISGFILEECSLWLEIRASVRPCVRASVRPSVRASVRACAWRWRKAWDS